jgi:hypothetical protein
MEILNWDGIDDGDRLPLRSLVEAMRNAGAIVEIAGLALKAQEDDSIAGFSVGDIAFELMLEAGRLVECIGRRALEVLDAQAAPGVATPAEKPRERRAAKRKAA